MDRLPTMPPDAGGATVPVAVSVELALTAPALTRTRSRFTRRAGCGGPVICARGLGFGGSLPWTAPTD